MVTTSKMTRYLFLLTVISIVFLPMTAFAKSSPVRAYFDISVIEATTEIDIRLTDGMEHFVSDVSAVASTKPMARFGGEL